MKWFKHETNAHTNLKLQAVVDAFGLEAYGYYWACVELVGLQSSDFCLKKDKNWQNSLKKFLGIEMDRQKLFLSFFANQNLIDKQALRRGDLFIPKLAERQDEYRDKVERKSRQGRDIVRLEENRTEEEKKRIEEIS